jgi:hypothetical protein
VRIDAVPRKTHAVSDADAAARKTPRRRTLGWTALFVECSSALGQMGKEIRERDNEEVRSARSS